MSSRGNISKTMNLIFNTSCKIDSISESLVGLGFSVVTSCFNELTVKRFLPSTSSVYWLSVSFPFKSNSAFNRSLIAAYILSVVLVPALLYTIQSKWSSGSLSWIILSYQASFTTLFILYIKSLVASLS